MSIKGLFPIDHWNFNSRSIFTELPKEDRDLLTENSSQKIYKKGESIFREGAFPSGIYFIADGKAKKYKTDAAGREHIIYVANSGEFLGYHAVLSEERYQDSAAALETSKISFIAREDFLWAIQHSPTLNRILLKMLSHEFSVFVNSITILASRPVRERLALQLIVLREKYKRNFKPESTVEIDMSRDDLANLVGTARENIVRTLTEFKKDGILETKGRKVVICDVGKLLQIAHYR